MLVISEAVVEALAEDLTTKLVVVVAPVAGKVVALLMVDKVVEALVVVPVHMAVTAIVS